MSPLGNQIESDHQNCAGVAPRCNSPAPLKYIAEPSALLLFAPPLLMLNFICTCRKILGELFCSRIHRFSSTFRRMPKQLIQFTNSSNLFPSFMHKPRIFALNETAISLLLHKNVNFLLNTLMYYRRPQKSITVNCFNVL